MCCQLLRLAALNKTRSENQKPAMRELNSGRTQVLDINFGLGLLNSGLNLDNCLLMG